MQWLTLYSTLPSSTSGGRASGEWVLSESESATHCLFFRLVGPLAASGGSANIFTSSSNAAICRCSLLPLLYSIIWDLQWWHQIMNLFLLALFEHRKICAINFYHRAAYLCLDWVPLTWTRDALLSSRANNECCDLRVTVRCCECEDLPGEKRSKGEYSIVGPNSREYQKSPTANVSDTEFSVQTEILFNCHGQWIDAVSTSSNSETECDE